MVLWFGGVATLVRVEDGPQPHPRGEASEDLLGVDGSLGHAARGGTHLRVRSEPNIGGASRLVQLGVEVGEPAVELQGLLPLLRHQPGGRSASFLG